MHPVYKWESILCHLTAILTFWVNNFLHTYKLYFFKLPTHILSIVFLRFQWIFFHKWVSLLLLLILFFYASFYYQKYPATSFVITFVTFMLSKSFSIHRLGTCSNFVLTFEFIREFNCSLWCEARLQCNFPTFYPNSSWNACVVFVSFPLEVILWKALQFLHHPMEV